MNSAENDESNFRAGRSVAAPNMASQRVFFCASLYLAGCVLSMLAAAQYAMFVAGVRSAWQGGYVAFGSLSLIAMCLAGAAITKSRLPMDRIATAWLIFGGYWVGHSVVLPEFLDANALFMCNLASFFVVVLMVAAFIRLVSPLSSEL